MHMYVENFIEMFQYDMDRIMITFGAGRTGWIKASNRILKEARETGLFYKQFNFDFKWLEKNDFEAAQVIRSLRMNRQFRGFGYWVWKPAILKWADSNFKKSHILYVDAGSHFRSGLNQIKSLESSLRESDKNGALAWSLPDHTEYQWTKIEVIKLINSPENQLLANQVQSGFISLAPSKNREVLVDQWRDISLMRKGFYFTDDLESQQYPDFIEHRHDQSILSLLWKQLGLYSEIDKTEPYDGNEFGLVASRNNTSLPYGTSVNRLQAERYLDLVVDKTLRRK